MRTSTRMTGILAVAGLVTLTGCASDDDTDAAAGAAATQTTMAEQTGDGLTASMRDTEDAELGSVRVSEVENGIEISAQLEGLESGFYGFHIHGTGACELDSAAPDDPTETGAFLSAGGHLGADESDHPDHPGDLPTLYVTDGGQATLVTVTDRFTLEDLQDDDGSAVMIHSGPDNFANIPDRYAPDGPDDDTLSTGDAGTRLACGVIE